MSDDDRSDSYTAAHPVTETMSCPACKMTMGGDHITVELRELWDTMHTGCGEVSS